MIITGLEVGGYVLEEVKAPENAAMITEQTSRHSLLFLVAKRQLNSQ